MDWKLISEIPGYEDYTNYELNIAGDLRNRKTGRILKWTEDKDKYLRAGLRQKGFRQKKIQKHVAICSLFKHNPDNKPIVDHKNRERFDNTFDNLRWVTLEENNQNRSISSSNTSGEQNICPTFNHGKPIWFIRIASYGKLYSKRFPRIPNSDVIPQEVIDYRDWLKRTYHPTTP
jgi:hypothetical protein